MCVLNRLYACRACLWSMHMEVCTRCVTTCSSVCSVNWPASQTLLARAVCGWHQPSIPFMCLQGILQRHSAQADADVRGTCAAWIQSACAISSTHHLRCRTSPHHPARSPALAPRCLDRHCQSGVFHKDSAPRQRNRHLPVTDDHYDGPCRPLQFGANACVNEI